MAKRVFLLAAAALIILAAGCSLDGSVSKPSVGKAAVVDHNNDRPGGLADATLELEDYSSLFSSGTTISSDASSLMPELLAATLRGGESVSQLNTAVIPGAPPMGDLIFCLDLTGSMNGVLSNAKANSINIMNKVRSVIPDTHFAVMSHMDYVGVYSGGGYSNTYGMAGLDYPYRLDRALTGDLDSVAAGIQALKLGSGADGPENYTRPFYESYADTSIGWRYGAKRILVTWGDNIPHDLDYLLDGSMTSTGPDPGRDAIARTADDLDLRTVLNTMRDENITMLALHSGGRLPLWQKYAQITGGDAFRVNTNGTISGVDIGDFIAQLILNDIKQIRSLELQVTTPGYASWLTSVSPAAYSNISLDETNTFEFDITVTAPEDAVAGLHSFQVALVGDGVVYATKTVEITVQDLPPVAVAGTDQTLEQTDYFGASATLSGAASYDPEGTDLQYQWTWNGNTANGPVLNAHFPAGTTVVTLVVTDEGGKTGSDSVTITVQDTTPPVLLVPASMTVEQEGSAGTVVALSASASDIADPSPVVTSNAPSVFPAGTTVVTFTATDKSGNSTSASMTVTVVDTTAPEISIDQFITYIWPPNHKLVKAMVISSSDIADPFVSLTIDVTHNQNPHNNKGVGDGNTDFDWVVDADGTVWIRSERDGRNGDRVYTVTATAVDSSGNSTVRVATVTVTHSRPRL